MQAPVHRPVLLAEAVASLRCLPGGWWVDGTLGAGGHAEAILRATAPGGRLLGCDLDAEILEIARGRLEPFGDRVVLRHADYRTIPSILDSLGTGPIDGALFDLGVSSLQFDDPGRGFSLRKDGPLDMRMDRTSATTAADLVNGLPERELALLLKRFGEEPAARRIARAIVTERARAPFQSTVRLAAVVGRAAAARRTHIDAATLTFQALRIAVNGELEGLDALLEVMALRLRPGGRLAAISFHSLEDRIVKRAFRGLAQRCICPRDLPICACGRPDLVHLVGSRPVRPGPEEMRGNPRSRSALLRAVERLGEAA